MRRYIFCVLQATAALDEKSKLEKSLKDLQMIQGDQKVNITRICTPITAVLHYCPHWSVWYVSFLAGTKLQVSIVVFLQALSHSCCSVSQQIMQSAGLFDDIDFVSNLHSYQSIIPGTVTKQYSRVDILKSNACINRYKYIFVFLPT